MSVAFTGLGSLTARRGPTPPTVGTMSRPDDVNAPESRPVALVVEDVEANRLLAASQLERLGWRCSVVSTGTAAIEARRTGSFDAILMDLQLPDLDGLEVTRRIRAWERQHGARQVAVIAVTASVTERDRRAAREAGTHDFLAKPVRLDALAKVLEGADVAETDDPAPSGRHDDGFPPAISRLIDDLGRRSRVATLVEIFLRELPQRVEATIEAMERGDSEDARRFAHMITSTSASLGADELAVVAGRIEQRSSVGQLAQELVDELARTAGETTGRYAEIARQLSAG